MSAVERTPQPWGWHLRRASALALLVLLPVQVLSTVVLVDLAETTAFTATERWEQPGWRILDWAVVVLGLGHGASALGAAVAAMRVAPWIRLTLTAILWAVSALLATASTLVVFTYGLP